MRSLIVVTEPWNIVLSDLKHKFFILTTTKALQSQIIRNEKFLTLVLLNTNTLSLELKEEMT